MQKDYTILLLVGLLIIAILSSCKGNSKSTITNNVISCDTILTNASASVIHNGNGDIIITEVDTLLVTTIRSK